MQLPFIRVDGSLWRMVLIDNILGIPKATANRTLSKLPTLYTKTNLFIIIFILLQS